MRRQRPCTSTLLSKLPCTSTENEESFKASRIWFDNFKRSGIHSVVRDGEMNKNFGVVEQIVCVSINYFLWENLFQYTNGLDYEHISGINYARNLTFHCSLAEKKLCK